MAFIASYRVSVDWTFSTWVNDQLLDLTEYWKNKKMSPDREKLKRTLNHAVVGLYLCVIFKWLLTWSALHPQIIQIYLTVASMSGKRIRTGGVFIDTFPQSGVHFWLPVPHNGYQRTREAFEVADKEQPSRLGFLSMEKIELRDMILSMKLCVQCGK